MKHKMRLRNCPILENTKSTWELSVIWNTGLDPGNQKDISGSGVWYLNEVYRLIKIIVS